jgi:hypothetical protein
VRKALTAIVVVGALVALFAGISMQSSGNSERVPEPPVSVSVEPTTVSESSNNASVGAWEPAVLAALQKDGPEAAIREYAAATISNPQLQSDCHHAYRYIGEQTGKLYGNVEYRTYACESGFVHGLLRELGKQYTSAQMYVSEVGKYCTGLQGTDENSCYHGLGHGAALAGRTNILAAVQSCDGLETQAGAQQCSLAVFMEFGDNALGQSIWVDTEFPPSHSSEAWDVETGEWATTVDLKDTESLCVSVPELAKSTCYFNLWKFVAATYKGPILGNEGFQWAAKYCSGLPEKFYEEQCHTGFSSLGIPILGATGEITRSEWPPTTPTAAAHLAQVLVEYCRNTGQFGACLNGLVPVSTSYLYNSGWEDENIPKFCEYTKGSTELAACENAVRIAKNIR